MCYHSGGALIGANMLIHAPEIVAGSINLTSFGHRIPFGALTYAATILKSAELDKRGEACLVDAEQRDEMYKKFVEKAVGFNTQGLPLVSMPITSYIAFARLSGLGRDGVSFKTLN